MIRVLVADDSATERDLMVALFKSDPDFEVVDVATTGADAVRLAADLRPDLIVLDVYMPRMNGFEATWEIMMRAPAPIMLVSAGASQQEAELSRRAKEVGAVIVTDKPWGPLAAGFEAARARFLATAKAMAQVRVVRRWPAPSRPERRPAPTARSVTRDAPRIVVVGASTGGPAALRDLLRALPADFPVPILVVQHIAHGFVDGLAQWLASACSLRIRVAGDGDPLVPGVAFLAPDDRHLGVADGRKARVVGDPPIGGFRPSATYLFQSAAEAFGRRVAAVILTGMGSDGVPGLMAVKAAGGTVLAQDRATSVIYGMPREAINAGVVDAELPLAEMAPRLVRLVTGEPYVQQHPGR